MLNKMLDGRILIMSNFRRIRTDFRAKLIHPIAMNFLQVHISKVLNADLTFPFPQGQHSQGMMLTMHIKKSMTHFLPLDPGK